MESNEKRLINEDVGLSFSDLLKMTKNAFEYLKLKFIIIAIFAFIGLILGFLKAYKSKPQYVATLSYVVEGQGSGSSGLGSLAGQLGFNMGVSPSAAGMFSTNNLSELLKSRVLLERVLLSPATINGETKSLVEFYIDFKELRVDKWYKRNIYPDSIHFPFKADPTYFSITQNGILANIIAEIGANDLINQPKNKFSSINEISFSSENEQFSIIFLRTLIKKLSELYIQTKTLKAKQNVDLLQRQADSVRNELNQALGAVAQTTDETYNLNPALGVKRVLSTRKQIDVQTNSNILSQLVQNLEMAKVSLMQETPLIQVIDEPRLPLSLQTTSKIKTMIMYFILFLGFISFYFLLRRWIVSLVRS